MRPPIATLPTLDAGHLPLRPYIYIAPTRHINGHTAESTAHWSDKVMSLQHQEPYSANDTNRGESLEVWSCVNCRRRKVRCDRRHPCASCTRNKTECVFPVSGRIPRRDRDANRPKPPAQKQAELVGRLRRLEAMVGDLSSQVEHVGVVSPNKHPVESSTTTSAASRETGWSDHRIALDSQSAIENPSTTRDGVQAGSGVAKGTLESPQIPDDFGESVEVSNGDLVIRDRFWTVFCKEVCSSSALFSIV